MATRVLLAPLHAGADRRRRRVEDRHAVAFAEIPPDILVGVVRRALVHHRRRAVHQRPVDDVGMAGDPADVGRAEVDVGVRLEVEDDLVRVGDAGQVAARRVQDALRLRRRAARVEDEQRVLGVERHRLALGVRGRHDLVVEDVALAHRAVAADVAHDDRRRHPHADLVDGPLRLGDLALAPRAVGGDQRLRLAHLHPLFDGLRREAAEDDVVRRADARAGEHRDDDLGDHRQVDPDDVALLDALVAQGV